MSVRLFNRNYLDPDIVSNATVSSEQSAFPVDNIYNEQRRSKVWRSDGYWEVTASNKTLVFRETTGVDLTATLTEGTYTSTTTFLAHIKTQMEAVGGSTYTIAQDTSTLKIKFTSDGGGGGGIFELRWTSSTGLAALLGFDSGTNDTGALSYLADLLRINSEEWIKWDMGISTNVQAFILIGARNDAIKLAPSGTFTLEANETDIWTSPSYSQTLTYDDRAISLFDEDGLHSEAVRYWRLKLEDTDNPLGYLEIGNLFLGDYFDSTRGQVQFPFGGNYVDRSATVFSEGGQTFSDIREKTEQFGITWFGLTVAEKESIDDFFRQFGTGIPFFVQFDPDLAFSSTAAEYIRYCKFENAPSYSLESPGNYSCQMSLREEL